MPKEKPSLPVLARRALWRPSVPLHSCYKQGFVFLLLVIVLFKGKCRLKQKHL